MYITYHIILAPNSGFAPRCQFRCGACKATAMPSRVFPKSDRGNNVMATTSPTVCSDRAAPLHPCTNNTGPPGGGPVKNPTNSERSEDEAHLQTHCSRPLE